MSKSNKFALIAGLLGGAALVTHATKKRRGKKQAALTLLANGACPLTVVYHHALCATERGDTGRVDFEVQQARELANGFAALTGVTLPLCPDNEVHEGALEILVGDTGREESTAFRGFLRYHEYGFAVLGDKIVVAGTNLTTTKRAVALFLQYLADNLVTDNEGGKTLTLDPEAQGYAVADEFFVDIPPFEAGRFTGTNDCDLGTLLVRFADTTPADFKAYCTRLEQNGYTLWQENSLMGSLFATYESERGMVYLSYNKADNTTRLVTAKAGCYHLPASPVPTEYERIADSALVQMACDYTRHEYGMSYIVALENGSFLIFDGGDNRNTNTYIDLMYEKLSSMNKRPDGRIVIEGWFISHTHVDHYGSFVEFCLKYGKQVQIRQVLLNTTSEGFEYNAVSPDRRIQNNMARLSEAVEGGLRFVKVHTGMRFYLGNAELEILHTPEDLYPTLPYYFNDTSIVWRMRIGGESSIYLGDIADRSSDVMAARFGDYLASDMVQVSHHGYVGATVELYDLIRAPIVLWPVNQRWYEIMLKPDFTYYKENLAAKSHGKEILVAEQDITLPLPYYKK